MEPRSHWSSHSGLAKPSRRRPLQTLGLRPGPAPWGGPTQSPWPSRKAGTLDEFNSSDDTERLVLPTTAAGYISSAVLGADAGESPLTPLLSPRIPRPSMHCT